MGAHSGQKRADDRRSLPPPPTFCGRAAELERLKGPLLAAASSRVRVAVIEGVAGVGKSALAQTFCKCWADTRHAPSVSLRAGSESLALLLDDLRRLLPGPRVRDRATNDERLDDLASRIDASGACVVVDDLHRLPHDDRNAIVGGLASRLEKGAVIFTSRERLAHAAIADFLELRLRGLDEPSARDLWASLDDLYGPSAGSDDALVRARGNPFALRRAHAGDLSDDPAAEALLGLSRDALELARVLALADGPVPVVALGSLLPDHALRAALRDLVTKLIIDVDGKRHAVLHDLFRETIALSFDAETRKRLSAKLSSIVALFGLPHPLLVRETTRHLVTADRYGEACEYLVRESATLVREGATRDLFASLERIPERERTFDLKLARARCFVLNLDFETALRELRILASEDVAEVNEAVYSFASAAFMAGKLDDAFASYERILTDPRTPPSLRQQVTLNFAWALSFAGRGSEGRALLRRLEETAESPQAAAIAAFYRAVSLWSDEVDGELPAALAAAASLDPDRPIPFVTRGFVVQLLAPMLAHLGKFDEARAFREQADEAAALVSDTQGQISHLRLRGSYLVEIGSFAEAVAPLSEAVQRSERAGSVIGALICSVWLARAELGIGERKAAADRLSTIIERARHIGALGIASSAERARDRVDRRVVLDVGARSLRTAGGPVDLARRATLERILVALARSKRPLSKEELGALFWPTDYHPLRHDNALFVNLRRLRVLLDGTGLEVLHDDRGYRLKVPGEFVLVDIAE